ncbi:thioredoxin-disulfide reductase [Candidatus Dependentiae bacterium]
MINKVVIIGSGPAGLTAGIYTARADLTPILIEGMQPGGQLTTTLKVENWPGMTEVQGPKLMMDIKQHAQNVGCQMVADLVTEVDFSKSPYKIFTKNGKSFEAESVIIATGASHRKLNVSGESEYWGKGVSVCATCDAPFFKDKTIVVVGGGNSGMYEASHLLKFAKKVIVIQNDDKITATDAIKNEVIENPNVEILYNSSIQEIRGDGLKVTSIVVENKKENKINEIETDGVFIAIGLQPNTKIFKDQLEIDDWGYLVCKNRTQTSKEGIFAAGDVVDRIYKQAITSSGQGCQAALDCQSFLNSKK